MSMVEYYCCNHERYEMHFIYVYKRASAANLEFKKEK